MVLVKEDMNLIILINESHSCLPTEIHKSRHFVSASQKKIITFRSYIHHNTIKVIDQYTILGKHKHQHRAEVIRKDILQDLIKMKNSRLYDILIFNIRLPKRNYLYYNHPVIHLRNELLVIMRSQIFLNILPNNQK